MTNLQQKVFIPFCPSKNILILRYLGTSKQETEQNITATAFIEGYQGTLQDKLDDLGWEIRSATITLDENKTSNK